MVLRWRPCLMISVENFDVSLYSLRWFEDFYFLGWLLNWMIHWHSVNSIIDERISACALLDFKVIFYVSSKYWWRDFDRFLILLTLFLFSSFWFQVSFLDVWFAVLNAEAVKELYEKNLESVNVKRSMPPNAWLWSMIDKCGNHGDIELLFDILKNLRRFVSLYSFFICIVCFYLISCFFSLLQL